MVRVELKDKVGRFNIKLNNDGFEIVNCVDLTNSPRFGLEINPDEVRPLLVALLEMHSKYEKIMASMAVKGE